MSKSLTARRNARKQKGKSYGNRRESGYTQSRAPHVANAPQPRTPCRMLVRRAPTEVVSWEVGPWTRDGECERTTLDVRFACGCTAHREAVVRYADGERERLMEKAVRGGAVFEALRKRHLGILNNMLRLAQIEFCAALPPHTEHFAR